MISTIIANITWNPDGWRNLYTNPQAGHEYPRDKPGHESLNFKFDKSIDKDGKVHGYIQWTNAPKDFQSGGLIIFYSLNTKAKKGEIVGIYGNCDIHRKPIESKYKGFEGNKLLTNVITEERLSMIFPIPLEDKKYKQFLNSTRLVPQAGFRWVKDIKIVKNIIKDEIDVLNRSGIRQTDFKKLIDIYEYSTGEQLQYGDEFFNLDLKEQDEIFNDLSRNNDLSSTEIENILKTLKNNDPETVIVVEKRRKRNNYIITLLKILRGFKCQICEKKIIKKNGKPYIEAAHIKPKCESGLETPDNILILCPNHHKEFDLGKRKIISHTKEKIHFKLNNEEISIKLDY